MIFDNNVVNFQCFFPNGSVIVPVSRVYYTYQVLMPLVLIDCIYFLSRLEVQATVHRDKFL